MIVQFLALRLPLHPSFADIPSPNSLELIAPSLVVMRNIVWGGNVEECGGYRHSHIYANDVGMNAGGAVAVDWQNKSPNTGIAKNAHEWTRSSPSISQGRVLVLVGRGSRLSATRGSSLGCLLATVWSAISSHAHERQPMPCVGWACIPFPWVYHEIKALPKKHGTRFHTSPDCRAPCSIIGHLEPCSSQKGI